MPLRVRPAALDYRTEMSPAKLAMVSVTTTPTSVIRPEDGKSHARFEPQSIRFRDPESGSSPLEAGRQCVMRCRMRDSSERPEYYSVGCQLGLRITNSRRGSCMPPPGPVGSQRAARASVMGVWV